MCAYCSQMDDDGDGDDHHVSLPHLYHSVMPTGALLHPCRLFACLIFLVLFSCDINRGYTIMVFSGLIQILMISDREYISVKI